MIDAEIVPRLQALVTEALLSTDQELPDGKVDRDAFLPEILDSIGLTALIALIEEEWGFEVADEEIEPEIFESLEVLGSFVGRKLSGP